MSESNGTEPKLENELGKLAEANHDLAEALAEERQAEAKIEGAEHRIEEIVEDLTRESKIKVNGRTRTVDGREVSFEELVKLAFPTGPTKPSTKFTVTFRNAAQVPAMGELDPGQNVKVKSGHNAENETIFNVSETVLS